MRLSFLRNRNPVDTPLKRRRLRLGLTQEAMAEQCGINKRTYEGYEQARRVPKKEHLQALMQVADLPWEAFAFPLQYLRDHPEQDAEYAERASGHGRPPRTG